MFYDYKISSFPQQKLEINQNIQENLKIYECYF